MNTECAIPSESKSEKDPHIPKEEFSPTQLQIASQCPAKWGFQYLWGLKPDPTPAQRFGLAIHDEIRKFVFGIPMSDTEAARRALTAVRWLPDLTDATYVQAEGFIKSTETSPRSIQIKSQNLVPEIEPIKIVGYQDLVTRFPNTNSSIETPEWYVFDYKSSTSFKYMHTEDTLKFDIQGNSYAQDIFEKDPHIETVHGRWIYILSKGVYDSRPVDHVFTRTETNSFVKKCINNADTLRKVIRLKLSPLDLPTNINHCSHYGGCPYHVSKNGPCKVTNDFSSFLNPPTGDALMTDLKAKLDEYMRRNQQSNGAANGAATHLSNGNTPVQAPQVPIQQAPQNLFVGQPASNPQTGVQYPNQSPFQQQISNLPPGYHNPVNSPEANQAFINPQPPPMPAPLPQTPMPAPAKSELNSVLQSFQTPNEIDAEAEPKRGRGRPPGSKAKAKEAPPVALIEDSQKSNIEKREFLQAVYLKCLDMMGLNAFDADLISAIGNDLWSRIEKATER